MKCFLYLLFDWHSFYSRGLKQAPKKSVRLTFKIFTVALVIVLFRILIDFKLKLNM